MSEIAFWLESYWPVIVVLVVVFVWMDYRNRLAATIEEFQLLLEDIRNSLYDANTANDVYERLEMKMDAERMALHRRDNDLQPVRHLHPAYPSDLGREQESKKQVDEGSGEEN